MTTSPIRSKYACPDPATTLKFLETYAAVLTNTDGGFMLECKLAQLSVNLLLLL